LYQTITALLGPGDQRHHHLIEAIRLPLAISDHCCDEVLSRASTAQIRSGPRRTQNPGLW
jgi:hypothetical protein